MIWLYYILAIIITILVHEIGHAIATLLCGAKIKTYSLGFGKPFISKKLWGIEFRMAPWLLGGYVYIDDDSFLKLKYRKKLIIFHSGCFINLSLFLLLKLSGYSYFKDILMLCNLIVLLNFLPVPPLDGSKFWTVFLSKKVNKILNIIGSVVLISLVMFSLINSIK